MKVDRFIRLVVGLLVALLFIVVIAGLLFVTESALNVWDRLLEGPRYLLYGYLVGMGGLLVAAVALCELCFLGQGRGRVRDWATFVAGALLPFLLLGLHSTESFTAFFEAFLPVFAGFAAFLAALAGFWADFLARFLTAFAVLAGDALAALRE